MEQLSVREVSERIDALLEELGQSAVAGTMERVEELVHAVMSLYGAGLDRIVETLDDHTLRRLADDEVVGNLLVLHDLHPDDVDTRVQRALEQVRPYLGSHAGGVSLSGVDEQGVVHLRLEGSCDGCPSSALTVKSAIEDAILVAAPDVVAVEAEGMVETGPRLLQIEPFSSRAPEVTAGTWEHLDLDVPPRSVRAVRVAGETIVAANLDGTLVAYADRCPGCLTALSEGRLDGDLLTCASGHAYDVRRAGRALDEDAAPLAPLPLLPDHGSWKVSLPRKVSA